MTLAQYAAGEVRALLDDGRGELALRVTTDYPHDGRIAVEVTGVPERPVTLRLRVPPWADGATLTGPDGATAAVGPGWATAGRTGAAGTGAAATGTALAVGDVVTLDLPVTPRLTWPDPRVDAVRGTVAVERGPLVLALESVDLPDGVPLDAVRLDPGVAPRAQDDGAVVRARAVPLPGGGTGRPPFGSGDPGVVVPRGAAEPAGAPLDLSLVPYHRWAERGPSTMRVFLPTVLAPTVPDPTSTTSREETR